MPDNNENIKKNDILNNIFIIDTKINEYLKLINNNNLLENTKKEEEENNITKEKTEDNIINNHLNNGDEVINKQNKK